MSKIIRNGIEYGGTATTANQVQYSPTETVADKIDELEGKTVEITQAEYDALPSEQKNNGTLYVITDAPSIVDIIYPVGSIYMSVNNVNPGTYLNGTSWEIWGSGRVPVGVSSDKEFNTVEKTGGEKAHKLTVTEMPNHNHTHKEWVFNGASASGAHYGFGYQSNTGSLYTKTSATTSGEVQFGNEATGGSGSHNNLQPYITCYMWKRIH